MSNKMTTPPVVPPPSQRDNPQTPITGHAPVAAPPGVKPSTVKGFNSISGEAPLFTYVNRTGNN